VTWLTTLKTWLKNLWDGFLGLVTRSPCAFCGKTKKSQPQVHGLCKSCSQKIYASRFQNPAIIWQKTAKTLPILAWGDYNPILKQAIFQLKYRQSPRMSQSLGIWLGQAWIDLKLKRLPPLIVVPITFAHLTRPGD